MKRLDHKIFCIGFNKTGTTSIHQLFRLLGMKSRHAMYSNWKMSNPSFEKFDCFSDGEMHKFRLLDKNFPNSKFILTVRPLDKWLMSRIKHVFYRQSIDKSGWMRKEFEQDNEKAVIQWIRRRKRYHKQVINHFKDRPEDLLIIDLTDKETNPAEKILSFLGLDTDLMNELPHSNQASVNYSKNGITNDDLEDIKSKSKLLISKAFEELNIIGEERFSTL